MVDWIQSSISTASEELRAAVVDLFMETFKDVKQETVDEDECLLMMDALSVGDRMDSSHPASSPLQAQQSWGPA